MRRLDPPGRARRRAGPSIALIAALAALVAAAPAAAATTYCVGFDRPGCVTRATPAQAFADAASGDRIELGALTATAPLDDDGRALDVVGTGAALTVLGDLTLSDRGSQLTGVTVDELELTGTAARVRVQGVATLHAGAALRAATVEGSGGVDAAGGTSTLDSVALDLTGGPGVRVGCTATLYARHVTLAGTPDAAVTTACPTSTARVSDSVLWVPQPFAGPGEVATQYTDHPQVDGRTDGIGDRHVPPGFEAGTLRPAAGSPLVDAGTPGGLAEADWPEDRDGLPRAADGDGDGILVRDIGAFERPATALPLPAGNLLRDPGAEDGGGWVLSGGFTRERYGLFPFPSAVAGAVLGGEHAFFSGGPGPVGAAAQTVDVSALAPEIDLGRATAALSGLLGGYRADADTGRVEATFLDPAGRSLGTVALAAPVASERANATTLLHRARADAVPPLTRTVAVTLRATRATGGYDDAYFDNLALTVTAPGAPPPPDGPPLKPFAGLRVLTGSARLDRKGRIRIRLACADGTVGSCAGVLTLTGALRKGDRAQPVALVRASVAPGTRRGVRLRLTHAAREALRARRRIRMTLFAAARDGQGLTRVSAVPVTVRRGKR